MSKKNRKKSKRSRDQSGESTARCSGQKKQKQNEISIRSDVSMDASSDSASDVSPTRGFTPPSNRFNISSPLLTTSSSKSNNTPHKHVSLNSSDRNKELSRKSFANYFYLKSDISNRIELAVHWNTARGINTDVIIKTTQGFLLKSNSSKGELLRTLKELQNKNIINEHKVTQSNFTLPKPTPPATFAAVIATVEQDIDNDTMSNHLTNNNIIHRYCKRITSRATNKPTTLIRVITGCEKSFQKLMNEGVFMYNKHYPVKISPPPPPAMR